MIEKKIIISHEKISILGINFTTGNYQKIKSLLSNGGVMIVPSAPSLTYLTSDSYYLEAMQSSEIAIPDSGLMVLILRYFYKIKLEKLSGLAFLRMFFNDRKGDDSSEIFLVEPNLEEHLANQEYLLKENVNYNPDFFYVAPLYKEAVIEDFDLLADLEKNKPKVVIINLGGGIQEKLGYFINNNLSYKPWIICTGAAIAFLSGKQAAIPDWADKYFLGWLFRCFQSPFKFIPRYLSGMKLIPMMLGCKVIDKTASQKPEG